MEIKGLDLVITRLGLKGMRGGTYLYVPPGTALVVNSDEGNHFLCQHGDIEVAVSDYEGYLVVVDSHQAGAILYFLRGQIGECDRERLEGLMVKALEKWGHIAFREFLALEATDVAQVLASIVRESAVN